MKNDLYKHEKSDSVKWVLTLIAFLIVGVLLAAVITQGFKTANPWGWLDKEHEHSYVDGICTECGEKQPEQTGGMLVGESTENGISLMSKKITKADYAAYGVSPFAESAQILTATVEPSNAKDKAVDWSIGFVNANSEWATGKTVTDYVTITPESDGALTATVECLQAFGEQIQVTVTHRNNEKATASCTVDFAKKLLGMRFFSPKNEIDFVFGEDETFDCVDDEAYEFAPIYSEYTLNDVLENNFTLTARINEDFVAAMQAELPEETITDALKTEVEYKLKDGKFVTTQEVLFDEFIFADDAKSLSIFSIDELYGFNASMLQVQKYHNAAVTVMKEHPDYTYYTLTLETGGLYSSFSASIKYSPDRSRLHYKVTNIVLGQESVVF